MATNNSNPFAEMFETFSQQVPSVDFNEIIEAGKKNAEIFQEINQAFTEGAQAIAQKQVEIARANSEEAIKVFKEVTSSKDIRDSAEKQAAFAKNAFEKAATDANALIEIATKSNSKAADVIGKQVSQSMKDFGKTAKKATAKAA